MFIWRAVYVWGLRGLEGSLSFANILLFCSVLQRFAILDLLFQALRCIVFRVLHHFAIFVHLECGLCLKNNDGVVLSICVSCVCIM